MQVMKQYDLPHYLTIENPNRFFTQNRYQADDGSEIFFFVNSHMPQQLSNKSSFFKRNYLRTECLVWDAETGKRFRISMKNGSLDMSFGPAESRIIVFNKEKDGDKWEPLPTTGKTIETINNDWAVELRHSRENTVETFKMSELEDLKDTSYVNFTGTAVYRKTIDFNKGSSGYLNLGKVWGISEVFVNGKPCGVKWYGNRIYNLSNILKEGKNEIEVHVITTMGNYMKTLTDNPTAQKFTVLKSKNQPIQSMGLLGPVNYILNTYINETKDVYISEYYFFGRMSSPRSISC